MFEMNNQGGLYQFHGNHWQGGIQNSRAISMNQWHRASRSRDGLSLNSCSMQPLPSKEMPVTRSLRLADYPEPGPLSDQQAIYDILDLIDDAVLVLDLSGQIRFLNLAAEELLGWGAEHLPFKVSQLLQMDGRARAAQIDARLEDNFLESQSLTASSSTYRITKDGQKIAVEYFTTPLYRNGQIASIAFKFRDISSSYHSFDQLTWQLNHDALTGLLNRSSFEESLALTLSSSSESFNHQHILCYLDLDRFRIINEVYDQEVGNKFLQQFSEVLKRRIRKTDILARLSGDEFGLILQHCNLEQALHVVKALQAEARQFRFVWQGNPFNFTLSVGVVILDGESQSMTRCIATAEAACAIAKTKGRDCIQVHCPNGQESNLHQGEIQGALRVLTALEENEFRLYYQSIIPVPDASASISSNCHHHGEILLRLQDKTGKIIPPGEFMPAAERYGFMHLIDRWVIRTLFSQLGQKIQSNQLATKEQNFNCLYSVNLSGASLNNDHFLEFVKEQFLLHAVPPQIICFEITETVAIANINRVVQFMNELREMGCRFALDDFGSGMSSFGYLNNLPVDYIKIDGKFVREITQNPLSREIVEAINRIGHAIGIQTTAEFVENQEILVALQGIGVDYAQGYGIGKPEPLRLNQSQPTTLVN